MRVFLVILLLWLSACDTSGDHANNGVKKAGVESFLGDSGEVTSSYVISDSTFDYINNWYEYHVVNEDEFIIHYKQTASVNRKSGRKKSSYHIGVSDPKESELWNKAISAHDVEIQKDVLMTMFNGGNKFEDTYQYFNINNGNSILEFTNSVMTISIPNTVDKRFVGFVSRNSNVIELTEKRSLGYLTYASNDGQINKLEIQAKNNEIYDLITPYAPDMNFESDSLSNKIVDSGKGLILWDADENYKVQDLSGITIVLSFFTTENELKTISVPIKNDEILHRALEFDKKYFKVKKS